MNSRILLIRPPSVMKGTSFISTQYPLNLASIASMLLKAGYEPRIWDYDVKDFDESEFKSEIEAFSPFMVGISCYTPNVINGQKIGLMVKKYAAEAVVVVGGTHVSALPDDTMTQFEGFDIGIMGEGEESMVELAERVRQGRPYIDMEGIVYRDCGKVIITKKRRQIKDLDSLPIPARHLLDMGLYKGQSHRGFSRSFLKITEIMTSRGCPNRCIFCASDVVMDKGVRFRSASSVKEEISDCVEKFGFNHFTISDDTFTLQETRLYDICEEFAKRKVTWNCNSRVWPISKKMLRTMADCGCRGVTYGVESGSPRILGLINKNITTGQIIDAFKWSKEAGIKIVEADVIIGSHPSETNADIEMTKKLLKTISPDVIMVSTIVPYPGTEIYKIMKNSGLIKEGSGWDSFILYGKMPSWRTDNFNPDDLVRIQKDIMLNFYFRPSYIFKTLKSLRRPEEAYYWLKAGGDFLMKCVLNKEAR